MRPRCGSGVLTLAIVLLCPCGDASGQALVASLVLDRSELVVGSPLLVRMALRNEGTETAPLRQALCVMCGSAVVQTKGPGDEVFRDHRPHGFGLKQTEGGNRALAPGETLGTYALAAFDREGRPVFDRVGRFEVRATFGTGTAVVTSAPVTVDVVAASTEAAARLESLRADLSALSLFFVVEPARLTRLRDGLAGIAEFADAIRYSDGLSGIHAADQARVRQAADLLEKLRADGRPLWTEVAAQALARHHARAGELDLARRMLTGLPLRTDETEGTEAILRERDGSHR